nr:hypothetical protein [Micromonospora wenchangensis]
MEERRSGGEESDAPFGRDVAGAQQGGAAGQDLGESVGETGQVAV